MYVCTSTFSMHLSRRWSGQFSGQDASIIHTLMTVSWGITKGLLLKSFPYLLSIRVPSQTEHIVTSWSQRSGSDFKIPRATREASQLKTRRSLLCSSSGASSLYPTQALPKCCSPRCTTVTLLTNALSAKGPRRERMCFLVQQMNIANLRRPLTAG